MKRILTYSLIIQYLQIYLAGIISYKKVNI
jgi:hypothetical protein